MTAILDGLRTFYLQDSESSTKKFVAVQVESSLPGGTSCVDVRPQSLRASGKGLLWPHILDEKLMKLERTTECFNKIFSDPLLELQLPKRGCLAGGVIKHAMDVIDETMRLHSPMVYKFGYTHCPKYRFHNKQFGYAVDKHQRWQSMIILFASHETAGPSFLEAILIEKFRGNLADAILTAIFLVILLFVRIKRKVFIWFYS